MQVSPRGYIFSGLEIIKKPLIEFIYDSLSKKNRSWWNKYIAQKLNNQNSKYNIPLVGEKDDLEKNLDELQCFKVIIFNEGIFEKLVNIGFIKELKDIRNDCAHKFRNGEIVTISYADDALFKMMRVMGNIDKESYLKLSTLRKRLHRQNYDDKTVLAGKDEIINFLQKEIWIPSIKRLEDNRDIDLQYKNELKKSMENALRTVLRMNDPEDITEWFRKHLLSLEGIKTYLQYKELGLITFEDKRLEFLKKCYGE